MFAVPTMSEDEKRWQREDDARALARAEEIKADKQRYENAKIGAKELLERRESEISGLKKVAGRKSSPNRAKVRDSSCFPNIMK